MIKRVEIQLAILRGWEWFHELTSSFDDDVLQLPVTQDSFDPSVWWTVKDHIAHCHEISMGAGPIIREVLAGAENPFVLPRTGHRMDFSKPFEEIMRTIDEGNLLILKDHQEKSVSEIAALGQRSLAMRLDLLASLTDEELTIPIPGAVWGDGTVSGILLSDDNHNKVHLGWVMKGLAANGARSDGSVVTGV